MKEAIGVGLSYRSAFYKDLSLIKQDVDFLEVIPENFFSPQKNTELDEIANIFPIFPHSLSLSIGTREYISQEKINSYKKFIEKVDATVISDHLCISEADNNALLDFLPVSFTYDDAQYICEKAADLYSSLQRPLLLENITYLLNWPNNELNELEFFKEILNSPYIYMLLDVTNLYINSYNLKYDPYEFLDSLPPEKIQYLHVSGCVKSKKRDILVDSHSEAINDEVWELLNYMKGKFPIKGIILERDLNFKDYHDLSNDIKKLKTWLEPSSVF